MEIPKDKILEMIKSRGDHDQADKAQSELPALIGTEVVPVERIRVSKYVVSDEQTVSAAVRREVVEQVEDPS